MLVLANMPNSLPLRSLACLLACSQAAAGGPNQMQQLAAKRKLEAAQGKLWEGEQAERVQ